MWKGASGLTNVAGLGLDEVVWAGWGSGRFERDVARGFRGQAMLAGQMDSGEVARMAKAEGLELQGQGKRVGEGKLQPGGWRV